MALLTGQWIAARTQNLIVIRVRWTTSCVYIIWMMMVCLCYVRCALWCVRFKVKRWRYWNSCFFHEKRRVETGFIYISHFYSRTTCVRRSFNFFVVRSSSLFLVKLEYQKKYKHKKEEEEDDGGSNNNNNASGGKTRMHFILFDRNFKWAKEVNGAGMVAWRLWRSDKEWHEFFLVLSFRHCACLLLPVRLRCLHERMCVCVCVLSSAIVCARATVLLFSHYKWQQQS